MERNKQIELLVLLLMWMGAIAIQYIITDAIASYIKGHYITDFRDELIVGFVVGFLIALGICLFAKNRIELEGALIISVIMALILCFWPYLCVKDKIGWVYPVFFVECAPMCALMWKVAYRWVLRVNVAEVNKAKDLRSNVKEVAKAESLPQTTSQGQEEPKKEVKPIEQPPQPPKEPLAKTTRKSRWRIDP